MNKSEQIGLENSETPTGWRSYIKNIEMVSEEAVKKFDELFEQLNDATDTEMVAIKKEWEEGVTDGSLRQPLGSLVNMFRPYLSQEERAMLNEALRMGGDRDSDRFSNISISLPK